MTVTVWPLAADRVNGNVAGIVPESPSETIAPPMETVGTGSSLVIVPVPTPDAMDALVALLSETKKVSSTSFRASPITDTISPFEVSPGLNVRGVGDRAV